MVDNIQLQPLVPDRFIWKWTANGEYSASSAYHAFFVGMTSLVGATDVWKVSVPPKVKFFFWLALHGRLWTAERQRRHGLQQDAACALCGQADETTNHLLVGCVFTREVWHRLLARAGRQDLGPSAASTLADWWQWTRRDVPESLRGDHMMVWSPRALERAGTACPCARVTL